VAIRDLLWACPLCGAEEAIRPSGKAEACTGCGAIFRRGRGAEIVATPPGGQAIVRHAADWAHDLAPVRLAGEPGGGGEEAEIEYRRAAVTARFAKGYAPVHLGRRFLGRIEQFGPARDGTLLLSSRALAFVPAGAASHRWLLEDITAVQPSSGVLQIKIRRQPVVSFRFAEASVRLWEEALQTALRRFYLASGRGEIVEFQPRIAVR